MSAQNNADLVMRMLHAIEERQLDQIPTFYHPEIEFHWPPGLPYSGDFKGSGVAEMNECFRDTWRPLQPTEETRRMNPRAVATSNDGHVIVHYIGKGLTTEGRRFEAETLANYQVRDGKLVRAQMFYYDLPGLISFLDGAGRGVHA